ncbi:hypothetical protein PFDG_05289 [Plasmodium falciparum Dd2]|uniref:Uncharacterized protein n=1 Tax=Plasmodium falciparum (isolate Dd2) TaxID=57267 RepID=A0A0L7MAW4_PLAF4|nr:hypothetical protein PFDG_05289 [Plasmodium falciparum Dd2]
MYIQLQKADVFSFDNVLKYSADIYEMLQQKFGQNENKPIIGEEEHVDILNNIQGQTIKQTNNMNKLTKRKNIYNNI